MGGVDNLLRTATLTPPAMISLLSAATSSITSIGLERIETLLDVKG